MRRLTLFLALVMCVGVLSAGSGHTAALVVDLPDTPLTSDNVHFLSTFPTGTGVGGRFLGHYFFETTAKPGTFLPGGPGSGGVWAFDVTNPEQPVIAGHLPLPHWENENVEIAADRKFLLVSQTRTSNSNCESRIGTASVHNQAIDADIDKEDCVAIPSRLSIIDISNPSLMTVRSTLDLPSFVADSKGKKMSGPGHTATCVLKCRYVYLSSSRANQGVFVADLRNLDRPRILGQVWNSPAAHGNSFYGATGSIHDVDVDPQGYIWMAGSGGTALYAPVTDATVTKPRLLSYGRAIDDNYNHLIHHSSTRLNSSMVMINEESYATNCGWSRNQVDDAYRQANNEVFGDGIEGGFQIWQIAGKALTPVSMWKSEVADYTEGGGVATSCSSHWFTINQHKIVAIGWYDQGVRFLDVTNPHRIKQVGYWISENGSSSAAYFAPGRPDVVYVADYNRGLDVIKIDNGGRGAGPVVAPIRASWLANYRGVRFQPLMKPDPDFGYACMRPSWIDW